MKIPTTLEMDGIITERDIENRFFVMKPCKECFKYSRQDIRAATEQCTYCKGELGQHSSLWYSIRTFDTSKKLSATDKKKMGV